MSETMRLEAVVYEDEKVVEFRYFSARKVFGVWWSRTGVTVTENAMFDAWQKIVERERDARARE